LHPNDFHLYIRRSRLILRSNQEKIRLPLRNPASDYRRRSMFYLGSDLKPENLIGVSHDDAV